MNLFEMFKSSPAFHKQKIYTENDLKDAVDLVEKCLKWVPKDRISADDALLHKFC